MMIPKTFTNSAIDAALLANPTITTILAILAIFAILATWPSPHL